MENTQFSGLKDQVHDAQITFRTLLNALSYPGTSREISIQLTPPPGLTLACAAACLTLFDLETIVWLSEEFESEVKTWLKFHTGCHFTDHPQDAHFGIIHNINNREPLSSFNWGTAEKPERSTTLLIQFEALETSQFIRLNGPGVFGVRVVKLPLSASFIQEWKENHQSYPLGVDVFLFGENTVIGLPRTTNLSL
ncbi:phosphonate C-P lyase system protein PhnH [Capilliphycus salinus ALCB114379]|uniref:phosphonate C-P lyase system protein PhnH n=1 Tax=Capilliphycus salinus TaxID=2768948 RepID=UPI0039A582BB